MITQLAHAVGCGIVAEGLGPPNKPPIYTLSVAKQRKGTIMLDHCQPMCLLPGVKIGHHNLLPTLLWSLLNGA